MIQNAKEISNTLSRLIELMGEDCGPVEAAVYETLSGHGNAQDVVLRGKATHKCRITGFTITCGTKPLPPGGGVVYKMADGGHTPTGTYGGGSCITIGSCTICYEYVCEPA